MSLLELSATVLGIVYVVLLMRESIWCWVYGNLSVALMAWSCYDAKLFADMSLQVFYFAVGVYGYWHWRFGGHESAAEPSIQKVRFKEILILLAAFVLLWVVAYAIVSHVRSASMAEVDSLLFSASLVATYMQARKYLENWLLWIPINLSYMVVYHLKLLDFYVLLSLLYAVMSYIGWRRWRREVGSVKRV